MEVEHVMGSFYCCRRSVYEELGGFDERILRGQTLDFGLRARLAGWICMAVPHIEYVHAYDLRILRRTYADSKEGINESLAAFERKWGFHRIAPDLDEAERRYGGTPLLCNHPWFRPEKSQPADAPSNCWTRYLNDHRFQQKMNLTLRIVVDMVRQVGKPNQIVEVGCRDGLLVHLLSQMGLACIGLDRHKSNVESAQRSVENHQYPATRPTFRHMPNVRQLPMSDGEADLLLLIEQMERHPNPPALLAEARRVVRTAKHMLVISRRQQTNDDPSDPNTKPSEEHYYVWKQLLNQLEACGGWRFLIDPDKDDPTMDMIVALERKSGHIVATAASNAA